MRQDLQKQREKRLENYANNPANYFIDESNSSENLGGIIGSGSYFVTVDNNGSVLKFLQPYALQRANYEFKVMRKTCEALEVKYPNFSASAQGMAIVETDLEIGKSKLKLLANFILLSLLT